MANQIKCLRVFVKATVDQWPTPGEAMAYNCYEALPCDSICQMIELLPGGNPQPANSHRCLHDSGLRFFYQVSKSATNPQVKRGSLIATYQFPKSPNNCNWVEFIKWCSN